MRVCSTYSDIANDANHLGCDPAFWEGKGKVLPRTGREDPEGEQMYSCTLSLTPALDGGGW